MAQQQHAKVCAVHSCERVGVCMRTTLMRVPHTYVRCCTLMTVCLSEPLLWSVCVYSVVTERFSFTYTHTADDCGGLSNPANGTVNTDGGTTFKCRAVYTCDTGYTLNGTKVRRCEAGGNWTNSEPTCDSESTRRSTHSQADTVQSNTR